MIVLFNHIEYLPFICTDTCTDIYRCILRLAFMLQYGLMYLFQHKVDEGATLALLGTPGDGVIVGLLVGIDHILHRQVRKSRVPAAEDKRLP